MPSTVAVDRMSDQQLWDRIGTLIHRARWPVNQGPQDLNLTLDQLHATFQELKLRGQQLELLPPAAPFPNDVPSA
jgi:hypothetical protein